MIRRWGIVLGLMATLGMAAGAQAQPEPHLRMEILGVPDIVAPPTPPTQAVVLFSDQDGWNEPEQQIADALARQGAVVMGLDTPGILRRMEASDRGCLLLIGQIEAISHQIQSHLQAPAYAFPTLAGVGEGGTVAMAIASHTEAATVARIIAVDPNAVVTSRKRLCSPAAVRHQGAGWTYDLPQGPEPFAITVFLTGAGSATGADYAHRQQERRRRLVVRYRPDEAPYAVLADALAEPIPKGGDALADLPLVDLPSLREGGPYARTVAIFYSGDGGWRDLDKDLAALLRSEGLAVVGFDVLRYFWKRQTPEQTAQDLDRMISSLVKERGFQQVALIGFSFGADILPATYNRLSPENKQRVVQLSLLGVSQAADFEVTVSGWLSRKLPDALPIPPELAQINPALIQCFYGEEDNSALCQSLDGSGAEVIRTAGGHHFDGDYQALARRVLKGLAQR
jgi:type IV secretory pathway VirJ component